MSTKPVWSTKSI